MSDVQRKNAENLMREAGEFFYEKSRNEWRERAKSIAKELSHTVRENDRLSQINDRLHRRLERMEKVAHRALKLASKTESGK